jgi:protein TIF31
LRNLTVLLVMQVIALQEMVLRAAKHILRSLLHGLSAEQSIYALSHFLNCLLGAEKNANPKAHFESYDFLDVAPPAYTKLTPTTLHEKIIAEVEARFRWKLEANYFTEGMKKRQLLRELANRTAFQLEQREYAFSSETQETSTTSEAAETTSGKNKKAKKSKSEAVAEAARNHTFEPSDIVTLLPIIKGCAPSVSRFRNSCRLILK